MFKDLIKKVREESTNSTLLPENNLEDTNGHLTRDIVDTPELDNNSTGRVQRQTKSSVQSSLTSKSRTSSHSIEESKNDLGKIFVELLSPYVNESVTPQNYIEVLKSWIDSKDKQLQKKDETVEELTQQTQDLQQEISQLRNQLTDLQTSREKNTSTSPSLQRQIDILRTETENHKLTIKSLRAQLEEVETERDDLLIKSTDISSTKSLDELQRQLERDKEENQQLKAELEHLRGAVAERDAIIEEQDKRLIIDHETQSTQTDEDKSFVEILAEPNVDTIEKLQSELDEKDRTIKVLQQRYNDLRKTLQREFHASIPKDLNQLGSTKANSNNSTPSPSAALPLIHYDSTATSQSDVDAAKRASTNRQMTAVRKNVSFTPVPSSANSAVAAASPAILPHSPVDSSSTRNQKNGHRSSIDGVPALNPTNFKYLKHVLLKFMTSTEDEAIHLIRAVSTLLNFSSDEERLLRETLDYKMSWFGKVSRLKPLTSNTNY